MNISQAIRFGLSGKQVKQLPYQFTCPACGRDNGMDNMPFAIQCNGYGCYEMIEAQDNEHYVRPSMLTLQIPE